MDAKLLKETLGVFQIVEVKPKKNKEDLLMLACQKKSEVNKTTRKILNLFTKSKILLKKKKNITFLTL